MQVFIKIALSVVIILAATAIGKKLPLTAGLIGVMPLTGALVLVWMYLESSGDANTMQQFTKGALWGILTSWRRCPTKMFDLFSSRYGVLGPGPQIISLFEV